jgi:hypothetical protein
MIRLVARSTLFISSFLYGSFVRIRVPSGSYPRLPQLKFLVNLVFPDFVPSDSPISQIVSCDLIIVVVEFMFGYS